ncbi:hypothetical protein JCM5353_007248 [Sporobolomyces roseus]
MSPVLRNRSSLAASFLLVSISSLPLPLTALAQTAPTSNDDLGFFNPTAAGGSWLTTWNNWYAGGEPLNVVISSKSDPSVLEYEGFLDYCTSLRFSPQCFQWVDHDSLQAAHLGDGNELVNQTTILRYNYDDPVFGTCSESLQGGNHFRAFRQNGTTANSGAWFLAVSKEHNLYKDHMIIPNGYDLGRDEVVEIATNPNGTVSPVSKACYETSVIAVKGAEYFGDLKAEGINHSIGIDGRIAVLTVRVVKEGNGKTASGNWFTSIRLPTFLIIISSIVFVILALGLFLFIHDHHNKHKMIVVAPWELQEKGKKGDQYPLLDRGKV